MSIPTQRRLHDLTHSPFVLMLAIMVLMLVVIVRNQDNNVFEVFQSISESVSVKSGYKYIRPFKVIDSTDPFTVDLPHKNIANNVSIGDAFDVPPVFIATMKIRNKHVCATRYRTFSIGDSVNGYRIIKIENGNVTLKKNGNIINVTIRYGDTK